MLRCPDCGQRLGSDAPQGCSLCGFRFHDSRSTSDDTTIYADAYSREAPGWWAMCRWVFFASASRTKHLGLMRASMASRHFATVNVFLLSFGLAIIAFTEFGWAHKDLLAANPDASSALHPVGSGWFQLVAAPRNLIARGTTDVVNDLWWNPAQAIIAVGVGAALGWLVLRVLLFLVRGGVTLAHRPEYRKESRMTAAINYGTAWFVPLLVAAAVLAFRPLGFVGEVAGWRWMPADGSLQLIAGVLAGFGVGAWWYWSVRLGFATPAATRTRVTVFYAIGVPVLTCAAVLAWRGLLSYTTAVVFQGLDLLF